MPICATIAAPRGSGDTAMLGVLADSGWNDGFALGSHYHHLIVEVRARDWFANRCRDVLRGDFF